MLAGVFLVRLLQQNPAWTYSELLLRLPASVRGIQSQAIHIDLFTGKDAVISAAPGGDDIDESDDGGDDDDDDDDDDDVDDVGADKEQRRRRKENFRRLSEHERRQHERARFIHSRAKAHGAQHGRQVRLGDEKRTADTPGWPVCKHIDEFGAQLVPREDATSNEPLTKQIGDHANAKAQLCAEKQTLTEVQIAKMHERCYQVMQRDVLKNFPMRQYVEYGPHIAKRHALLGGVLEGEGGNALTETYAAVDRFFEQRREISVALGLRLATGLPTSSYSAEAGI